MTIDTENMRVEDSQEVYELWLNTPGVNVTHWESPELLHKALAQENTLGFVVRIDKRIVGALLAGNCGLRGFIQHLAVDEAHRKKGIGRALVEACAEALKAQGVHRLVLGVGNPDAISFWQNAGFEQSDSVVLLWRDTKEEGFSSKSKS